MVVISVIEKKMTITNELDLCLRAFISEPGNFLNSISLVNALHGIPVWASTQPYALEIEGLRVTPVFTDENDLETLKKDQESARHQVWEKRSVLEVLEEVIQKGLSGLVFNLKSDGDFGNSTIFKSSELIQFLNNYTTILNRLMGEENRKADTLEKYYLVPTFVFPRKEGTFKRTFPLMSNPEGYNYVPAFSNLSSFSQWYNHEEFGVPFRKANGGVSVWHLEDIYHPDDNGENAIDETVGVAINPLDNEKILVDWSTLDE